jgi:2-succinyl-5-enolpyruvyl-6-hydroxy-3-cyclohexene-1-carboxylate synthase
MPPSSTLGPQDVSARFCATLVDEWACLGVRHAVIAPGSRSTPLALALADSVEIQLDVFHDERSASFAALGIGLATGVPAVVLCSSGTAATHFHAAVVEAHQSAIPMIVCTADRPPELRDVGAPQTIDQTKLYGAAVRWFVDPGVAENAAAHTWRSTAAHAVTAATGHWPGPVHLNLAFREPLIGEPGELPPRRALAANATTTTQLDAGTLADIERAVGGRRGVVVAGRGCGAPDIVADFAASIGWPVLADARSGLRTGRIAHARVAITAFDSILRHERFTSANVPEIVLQLGEPPASKVLARWLAGLEATQIHISDVPMWRDPDGVIDMHVTADVSIVCASLAVRAQPADESWLAIWKLAERQAQAAISAVVERGDDSVLSEPATARLLGRSLPAGASLVVSSSMPIRDVEWFASSLGEAAVYSNRGANGIDGVVATATGVALATHRPTFVLIGDVAFLHDSSSLVALAQRLVDVRIVLIDNDGGGIFNFLPQATSLPAHRFEQLFGTPHGVDLVALAAAHSLPTACPTTAAELVDELAKPGPRVVVVQSDRTGNVAVHEAINAAVADALR